MTIDLLALLVSLPTLSTPTAAPAQDPPPPPVLPGDGPAPAPAADAGPPPGVLPEGTTPDARKAWELFKLATAPRDPELEPVRAFDIHFDIRVRHDRSRNEANTRLVFAAPDLCRLERKGRTLAHGRKGYWLQNGDELVLLRGREYDDDRRQVDELMSIANNFLSLLDPDSLRIQKARVLAEAPAGVPEVLGEASKGTLVKAGELLWLAIVTPDFRLLPGSGFPRPPGVPPTHRVAIGLDPGTGRPCLASIAEEYKGLTDTRSALLVSLPLAYYRPIDGYEIPTVLHVHERAPDAPGFAILPSIEFGMESKGPPSLRPRLRPEFFDPGA